VTYPETDISIPTLSLCTCFLDACPFGETRLEMKLIKGSGGTPKLSYTGRDDRHFVPTGVYIVRTVNGRY
jgi:hypothetical protein